MTTIESLRAWAIANPMDAIGWAYVALGMLNALMPHKGDEASGLRRLLDILAPLAPQRFRGSLKIPGMQSVPMPPPVVVVAVEEPSDIGRPGPPSGPPAVLALLFVGALSACHLTAQTRAGLAFVAVAPSIEAGVTEYARWRVVEERAIGEDAVAACKDRPTVETYTTCTDAIVRPRRQRLDDVRLAVGVYSAAIAAATSGAAGDLPGAASRVIAALAAVGIRVSQEVK